MNINVARKLHERRYRPNPVMTTGELLSMIGSDGMQEAIEKRWITPDETTGFMMINHNGGKLLELEAACRCHCGKTDCACEAVKETAKLSTMPVREAFAGFGLPTPAPTGGQAPQTMAPMMPRPSSTPTSQAPAQNAQPKSGDTVKVTDEGKEFEGQVSGFEPDGRIRLRWGGARPVHDRPYGAGEYMVLNKSDQPSQPNA
jgi:hypothetical protein